jgi:putative glycosyltransferase
MKLSVVTTLYRSAASIEEFYRRIVAAAAQIAGDVELVMVNDGSPDNSLDLALELHRRDPRVIVVDLSRNFGHHKALMTGLAHASGDLMFLIDSDLEESPEDLAALYQRFSQNDCDVVFGVLPTRRGSFLKRLPGAIFFNLLDLLSDYPVPRNVFTARLMTRQYVQALLRHRDREFAISHLWEVTGFRQQPVALNKLSLSPTSYTLKRRVEMAIRDVTTTSSRLLYLIFYSGLLIFGLSIAVVLYFLGRYFTSGIGVNGFTSIIVSIWFLGGLITFILGILGIYVANILAETKRRPYTIVRRIYRSETAAAPASVAAPDKTPDR